MGVAGGMMWDAATMSSAVVSLGTVTTRVRAQSRQTWSRISELAASPNIVLMPCCCNSVA